MRNSLRPCFFFILILIAFISVQKTVYPYETHICNEKLKIAFDLTHGGHLATKEDLAPFVNNLTKEGNKVVFIEDSWNLKSDVNALFLTQSELEFTENEVEDIKEWMNDRFHLLWISGDSDDEGFFNPEPLNNLLLELGAISRLDSTSIRDSVYNDGDSLSVAVPYFGVDDRLYDRVATSICSGMEAGVIFHNPCSIIAYDGYYYKDLRHAQSTFPERVMLLMTYSENATALDLDLSNNDLDLYVGKTGGLFPAIIYENFTRFRWQGLKSPLIVSGDAIYTSDHHMYNQFTENGIYNSGIHYGQMFVNHILSYFLCVTTTPEPPFYYIINIVIPSIFIASIIIVLIIRAKGRKKVS